MWGIAMLPMPAGWERNRAVPDRGVIRGRAEMSAEAKSGESGAATGAAEGKREDAGVETVFLVAMVRPYGGWAGRRRVSDHPLARRRTAIASKSTQPKPRFRS